MDENIREAIRAGRYRAAFEQLLPRYRERVFRLACGILRHRATAEGATQEASLRIWRTLPEYEKAAELSTWIYAIARNTCVSTLRRRRPEVALDCATWARLAAQQGQGDGHPVSDLAQASIGQVALTVRDLATAVAFYRDTLGLTLEREVQGMAFFRCGGTGLMVGLPTGKATQPGTSILHFRVENIDDVHATLTGRGVAFLTPPQLIARLPDHELWMAFFRDPDGNSLALMAERPASS